MIAPAPRSTSFTILREVARGGAGAVYEAMDEVLGRRVAFKVYHREGEDRMHLEREVRLAAKLAGAGIVRVLDASPESGWIALEWVGAGSLREWIREAREELAPIERWAVPLARALGRVHRAGLVHLDVKPGNVLMRERDEPLLTDFGIARELGEKTLGGSAGYLSPERLAGAPASAGDDLYGFGRILEDALDALSRGAPREDAPLRRVVERCLAPAAERFASAEELTAALCR
ncbi:MAG: serine/threonine-protein kinase [Polyangiaceae bacterium]